VPEKTYRAVVGLCIIDTTDGKFGPFFNVGLTYDGLKDAHRQVIQDVLLDYDEEITEALSPVIERLNEIGQIALHGDDKYAAGQLAAEAVKNGTPSRKRKRRGQG